MLKVFLVEDESVIRDGLRDNIPWEQYGYQFVGEAADGEMALPLIRRADHGYKNAVYGRTFPEQDRKRGISEDEDHHYQRI